MEVMKQLEKNGIGFSVDNVETPKLNSNSLSTDNIRGPSEPEFYKLLKNKQQFSISVMDKELFEKMNIAHEQFQALPVVERLKLFKMEDLLETQNIEKNSLAVNGRIKDFSPYIFAMLAPDVMSNLGYSFDDMVIHCKFRGLQCENGIRQYQVL
uniref:Uncharacterized protein n=1 Tax=Romanomermis culicivorax TaxID=13658 RepID=A0A915J648_ROMCU